MARPAAFDRDEAIKAAMHEIWRRGYEATSIKAMSERLGITRSSYYNAFGSRQALFKAVLDAYFEQTPDRPLHQDIPPTMTVRQLLTGTFHNICRARASDPERRGCLAVNSLSELAATHDELGPMLVSAVNGSVDRIEALLKVAVQRGEFDDTYDTHAGALALQTLMIGVNVFAKALKTEDELWLAVQTTLHGLGLYEEPANE